MGRAGRLAGGDRQLGAGRRCCLWFGSIAWVIGYDTLYAIQDKEDDALVGRQIVGAAARRQGAARESAIFYATRACCCGARRSGRSGPTGWRLLTLVPAALHLANQALRADPDDGDLALRAVPLEPHAAACSSSSRCWSSAFPRARRAPHANLPTTPDTSPKRWSSAASPRARPPPTRFMPATARRACRSASARLDSVSRSEGEQIGLRLFVGQRSATVASSDLSDEALGVAGRALPGDGAAKRPRIPIAGLAPAELLAARRAARSRCGRSRASPIRPSFAPARWRPRMRRSPSTESPIRAAPGRARRRRPSRSRPRAAFPALTASTGHGCSAAVIAGEGATMQRDHAWHSARHLDDLDSAGEIGRRAGERAVARLNPRRPKPGKYPVLFDPRVSASLLGHFAGAISGSAIARKTSFLQDKLGAAVFGRGVTIVDDPLRLRGLRSRPFDGEGVRVSRRELVSDGMLNSWIAESASARQLGIEPTGHAARGVGGAPGASPSNLYLEAGRAQPRGAARAPFPKRC